MKESDRVRRQTEEKGGGGEKNRVLERGRRSLASAAAESV